METRKCKRCKSNFILNRKDKIFCSRTCKDSKKRAYEYYKYDSNLICVKCGFKGHRCQIDVDHIDGNHNNNDINNLQTLCANCHRLKTFINKDWKRKKASN